MWPLKLDMSKDECRGVLRRLELEAYSSVMSTFRAQGSLDTNKQNVLDQLRRFLHISEDRHKAEARRVANSEKLTTISELMSGRSYDLEWTREGHRNYPLIARAPPYSALHILADHASKAATIENSDLPHPSETKRSKIWDFQDISNKQIVKDDPTLPPPSPLNFGVGKKELKKNFDLTSLHQGVRKKHYQLLKPPPPHVKIQHLYQTLNTKRSRKSLTKKSSKSRIIKQMPGRMHLPYSPEDKQFDGAELQRHLTSQLMPPPMSPAKSPLSLPPILPTGMTKRDSNVMKIDPQINFIANNPTRLKSELLHDSPKSRAARSKSSNVRGNYQQKSANGSSSRIVDYIPDPQIIFNTTSSKSEPDLSMMEHINHNRDVELSQQAMASPLQLLSTAASCTPKLKVTPNVHQQPSTSSHNLPSKTVQNRAIKIVPSNAKPVIIKPGDSVKSSQPVITTQCSKFKIQKIQLVMNKSQEGATTNLSPSATIVSGKAGQLVLSGKGITNSYQIGGKSPYTIVNAQKPTVPKVQTNFSETIPENQRITENTPIDFITSSTTQNNYPKVIIHKSQPAKQIKLKLGTSIMNPKIIKGPIPANLKIQRNINTKGFTVVNSSQIVQFQQQQIQPVQVVPAVTTEGTKVDWEQELDDANRKDGKLSQGNGTLEPVAKKIRLEENEDSPARVVEEVVESPTPSNLIVYEESPQIEINTEQSHSSMPDNVVTEYMFLGQEEIAKTDEEEIPLKDSNDENISVENTKPEKERQPKNGAEAYESLVKSLTECENLDEEAPIDENFALENNILEQFSTFSRDGGLF